MSRVRVPDGSPFFCGPIVQRPRTPPFQGGDTSSNLVGTAIILEASVAQLVEQRTRNAQVSGPNPDAGSTRKNTNPGQCDRGFFIMQQACYLLEFLVLETKIGSRLLIGRESVANQLVGSYSSL